MSWVGWAVNRWVLALGATVAVLPLGGLLAARPVWQSLSAVLPVCALTLLGTLEMACVRVSLGHRGLEVAAGPWAHTIRAVGLADIADFRVELREAAQLGTRGYLEDGVHDLVMVRGGECLVLELAGGRSLTIAVDGAAEAAARFRAGFIGVGEG